MWNVDKSFVTTEKQEGMPILTGVPALTESTPSSGIFVFWDFASSTFHRMLAFSLHQISDFS
jgi:hypothetical protein